MSAKRFLVLFLVIPLIISEAYGASINFGEDCGSPGDTVTIPVTLNYIEGETLNICSIGIDIGFNPDVLENPQVEIGPAGSDADKDIFSNIVSPRLLRIGILGYNQNIISAGIVANVTFTIKADAADGTYTLTNTPSASDPDGNAISVAGVDGTVRVLSVNYSPNKQTLYLTTRWNLISLYLSPENSSVNSILGQNIDKVISIWKWEDNNWAVNIPNFTEEQLTTYIESMGFSKLTNLYCGEGFWVNASNEFSISISGTVLEDSSLSLNNGWNLVGLKGNQGKDINDLISGKEDKIFSVWKWKDNNWVVYLPSRGLKFTETYADSMGFSVLEGINPGEGFWVNAKEDLTVN